MIAFVIAMIALIALAVLIGMEITRQRPPTAVVVPKRVPPRRDPLLEERVRSAFDGPRAKHGDIFVSYAIWRREHETRLELFAADPFIQLNEFTRCLIMRHVWRALEALVDGAVVVVDSPPQRWSTSVDRTFNDRGIDPWRVVPQVGAVGGPHFARDDR